MDLKQAKQILTGMGLDEFEEERLTRSVKYTPSYMSVSPDHGYLSGAFTADELEAIATWMRDPSGVVGAE